MLHKITVGCLVIGGAALATSPALAQCTATGAAAGLAGAVDFAAGAAVNSSIAAINAANTVFLTQTTAFVSAPGNPAPGNPARQVFPRRHRPRVHHAHPYRSSSTRDSGGYWPLRTHTGAHGASMVLPTRFPLFSLIRRHLGKARTTQTREPQTRRPESSRLCSVEVAGSVVLPVPTDR